MTCECLDVAWQIPPDCRQPQVSQGAFVLDSHAAASLQTKEASLEMLKRQQDARMLVSQAPCVLLKIHGFREAYGLEKSILSSLASRRNGQVTSYCCSRLFAGLPLVIYFSFSMKAIEDATATGLMDSEHASYFQ